MDLNQILEKLGTDTDLPVGSIRELMKFDLSGTIARISRVAQKDLKTIQMLPVAIFQRGIEITMQFGIAVGKADPTESLSPEVIALGNQMVAFWNETDGLIKMWSDQVKELQDPMEWFSDPTKEEREIDRIYAKRNQLDAECQSLLGVSDNTATEYPAVFVNDYLN